MTTPSLPCGHTPEGSDPRPRRRRLPGRLVGHKVPRRLAAAGAALALGVSTVVAAAAIAGDKQAGPQGRHGVTPVGFEVTPAGRQTDLGDLPLSSALSPDGQWLAVSNDGQGAQSLQMIDVRTGKVAQSIPYGSPQALFMGLAFSPDGKRLYASAGGNNLIRTYAVDNGHLTPGPTFALPKTNPAGEPLNAYPAGLAVTPDGRRLVVADQLANAATVFDTTTGASQTTGVGANPYGVTVSRDGRHAYVANQGANSVSVLDLTGPTPTVASTVTVGTHPNQLLVDHSGSRLYVANGDSDEVSVIDTATNAATQTISLAPRPGAEVGSNPDGLAVSSDDKTLYVANSGNNDVAVIDVQTGSSQGLIPTGWYPTSVVASGNQLLVTNAKGLGAGPNDGPGYPNPYSNDRSASQYVGSMMVGTLSILPVPSRGQLAAYTRQVVTNDGFDHTGDQPAAGAVVPRHLGEASPIKHVIYVVRENRTFDQVLGSLGKGNGDPALNLFGDNAAPNARQLARQFVTFDNFYANAEVSAQGWNWSVAANSNPYSEATWPANYSARNHPYPSESGDPAIAPNRDPADAYIWDRLADNGASFRNYGFYVDSVGGQQVAADPRLDANTDRAFRGFDMACPDTADTFTPLKPDCGAPRIEEWLREFNSSVATGNLPTVQFVRLPNDHTSGTTPGSPTPSVYVADNDWALGKLVDAVSHSPFWASTAIFVTEDDAQNGPDHVDAHRTVSEVISPYTRRGTVDSTFYSTASMLRTVELLAGIRPLTQFDAYSTPMSAAFTSEPDTRPYQAIKPTVNFNDVNTASSPMAAASARQSLAREDQIDEAEFNQAIWQSVKGKGSKMPAPRHSLAGGPPPNSHGDTDG